MIFLTGTDTDVGKTFTTKGLVFASREYGIDVVSYKPIESGGVIVDGQRVSSDIDNVMGLSNLPGSHKDYNTFCLSNPLSPHLAFEKDGLSFNKSMVFEDYMRLREKHDEVIVEGAGGIIVPIVRNQYYVYDLIKDLGLDVILVTRTKLGTINHTLLSIEFLKSKGIEIKAVIFNGYTGSEMEDDNIKTIVEAGDIRRHYVIDKIKSEDEELIKAEFLKKFSKDDVEHLLG